jgi:hypothetical protein
MLNLLDVQSIGVGCSSFNISFEGVRFHIQMLEMHSNKLFLLDMYIYRVSVTH